MNVIQQIYLKTVRYRLYKSFKFLGVKKRDVFLISPPGEVKGFLKVLPFIGGIRKIGNVILLLPETFAPYIGILKPNTFQTIYWKNPPQILTRESDTLKKALRNYQYNWLIELNEIANLSLPNLVDVEKRIAFYRSENFPYYNILIKDGIESLINFFQITSVEPGTLFKFNKLELKTISKKLPAERPLLFVNTTKNTMPEGVEWQGGLVVYNKMVESGEEGCKRLFLCDAYYGPDDEFCEIARIFKKEIIGRI